MAFKLSQRSLSRLEGVDDALVAVTELAIQYTAVDFGVTSGVRTAEEQHELFKRGASQCDGYKKKSKHQSGLAVDVVGYIGPKISWEVSVYDDIADAFKKAANELGVSLRWGAAWHISDITAWQGTMKDAMNDYIDLRRGQGKRPFIDAPHFELL